MQFYWSAAVFFVHELGMVTFALKGQSRVVNYWQQRLAHNAQNVYSPALGRKVYRPLIQCLSWALPSCVFHGTERGSDDTEKSKHEESPAPVMKARLRLSAASQRPGASDLDSCAFPVHTLPSSSQRTYLYSVPNAIIEEPYLMVTCHHGCWVWA